MRGGRRYDVFVVTEEHDTWAEISAQARFSLPTVFGLGIPIFGGIACGIAVAFFVPQTWPSWLVSVVLFFVFALGMLLTLGLLSAGDSAVRALFSALARDRDRREMEALAQVIRRDPRVVAMSERLWISS